MFAKIQKDWTRIRVTGKIVSKFKEYYLFKDFMANQHDFEDFFSARSVSSPLING